MIWRFRTYPAAIVSLFTQEKIHRKGSVGDNRVYTLRRQNANKRIPVYTVVARENRTEFTVVLTAGGILRR